MKRTLLLFLAVAFAVVLSSCGPVNPADGTGEGGIFILGNFQLTGTTGGTNCTVMDTADDSWVNTATVTLNSQNVPFVSDGAYVNSALTGTFATGDTVTMVVSGSFGTATASGTIPASGSVQIAFTGNAKTGSIFSISH